MATYCINPTDQWWGQYVPVWGERYSLILGLCTITGAIIRRHDLLKRYTLDYQEILLIIFLSFLWLSRLNILWPDDAESMAVKLSKVSVILLIGGRLISDEKTYNGLIWTFILTGFYLGLETYNAPSRLFFRGRLTTGIGGTDFAETNFLAAHFSILLPFIGIKFLTGGWKIKGLCILSGGFIFNGMILCRSRGAFLGVVAGGICAVFLSEKRYRKKIFVLMVAGLIAGSFLVDPGFLGRIGSMVTAKNQIDNSSKGRIEAWKVAMEMVRDRPLGIGEGQFKKLVGTYNPEIPNKDTHNTYLRCLAEIGVQGLLILCLMMINAFRQLSKISKALRGKPSNEKMLLNIFALRIALVIFLTAGFFITETYIEEFYWLLMMPIFLKRIAGREFSLRRGMTAKGL